MGLQDAFGTGYYNWRDPSAMLDTSFRNWRRRSDRSDRQELEDPGTFINNGDNCVHLVPWVEDPMIAEQGSFEEVSCFTEKAFVCQRLISSSKYTMTSLSDSKFMGNAGIRGGFLILEGIATFDSFFAENSATITAQSSMPGPNVFIRNLILRDGSNLILNTDVLITDEAFIGEQTTAGMQPTVTLNAGVTMTATNCPDCINTVNDVTGHNATGYNVTAYNVTVNADFNINEAYLVLSDNISFVLSQGGDLSSGNITAMGEASRLSLGGYSTRLATYDSFDVRLAHRYKQFCSFFIFLLSRFLIVFVGLFACLCGLFLQRYSDRGVL